MKLCGVHVYMYSLLEATSDCACLHAAKFLFYSLLETVDCTQNMTTFHLYTITEDIHKEVQQV